MIGDGITAAAIERMGVADSQIAEKKAAGITTDIGGEAGEVERLSVVGFKSEFLGEEGEGGGFEVVAGAGESELGVPFSGFGGSLILEGCGKSRLAERGGVIELQIAGMNGGGWQSRDCARRR